MINLGLSRISKLLSSTAIPWKAVHIAGTNGKGSVANFISSLLQSSGFSVGRFNSPHLVDRWDCITINQKVVDETAFKGVEKYVKTRNKAEKIDASEFEILTATAFEIFSRAQVDIGVIECGMGGRLDATNILKPEQVLCSVFTKIGMDHEAFLGDTVLKIAKEKAGIMKKGVPFVADQSNQLEVLMELDDHAAEVGAKQGISVFPADLNKQITMTSVRRTGEAHERGFGAGVDSSQWPLHQQQNLRTALLAWNTLQFDYGVAQKLGRPFQVDANTGMLGLAQVSAIVASQVDWPGRLQLVNTISVTGDVKPMLLDGAHNEQAARALARHVDATYRPRGPVVWLIAMTKGKNVRDFLSALLRHGDQVVITQFGPVDGMPWVQSEDLTQLAQEVQGVTRGDVHIESEPWNALRRASQITLGESQVVICGSLYLAGDVLGMLTCGRPRAIEGPDWDAWVDIQREKLELRVQRVSTGAAKQRPDSSSS
jgi:folylpolyglutamate synthase/dihydrofolate synthase